MSLITHQTAYAERALTYIAESEKDLVSSSEIINKLKIPKFLTRQILSTLKGEGILKSTKGSKGGFQLAVPREKVSFYDLVRIFQGEIVVIDCLAGKMNCNCVDGCHISDELKHIEGYVKNRLRNLKVINR